MVDLVPACSADEQCVLAGTERSLVWPWGSAPRRHVFTGYKRYHAFCCPRTLGGEDCHMIHADDNREGSMTDSALPRPRLYELVQQTAHNVHVLLDRLSPPETAGMQAPEPVPVARDDAEALARLFHETYERLAPDYSYTTRKESAVPWASVPDDNKGLMIATAAEVMRFWLPGLREAVIDLGVVLGNSPDVATSARSYTALKTQMGEYLEEVKRMRLSHTTPGIAPAPTYEDVATLLRLLELGDHARPASTHQVMVDEIIPAVEALLRGLRRNEEELAAAQYKLAVAEDYLDNVLRYQATNQQMVESIRKWLDSDRQTPSPILGEAWRAGGNDAGFGPAT